MAWWCDQQRANYASANGAVDQDTVNGQAFGNDVRNFFGNAVNGVGNFANDAYKWGSQAINDAGNWARNTWNDVTGNTARQQQAQQQAQDQLRQQQIAAAQNAARQTAVNAQKNGVAQANNPPQARQQMDLRRNIEDYQAGKDRYAARQAVANANARSTAVEAQKAAERSQRISDLRNRIIALGGNPAYVYSINNEQQLIDLFNTASRHGF